ncbi:MAG: adenylate/guanylate cyclase domain-containing protein [Gammaproteobacteria bacterium]|nr:adenylate/guanylate cyclase domain-containing protein [Gammaproteobacteria bacterium]MBU1623722.1 adenylate/guanylate cyclase domain-containing protein [Gammaproteobacteria bacterium]
MEQRGNKTIVCSVFFLDIVEYSKKSVSGQISLKERFNAFLSIAIRDVPVADRIILDTGDGAAISFLGDIEDALQAALSVRSSLLGEGVRMEPPLLVRMGVNLGPVRLVKDINDQPNIVGDGINVAQRVMGFADPGQILVSRSYYDAVSRLSQEYAGMFHYQGSRTDKHVREHEVYAIGYPGDFTTTQRSVEIEDEIEHAEGVKKIVALSKRYWYEFLRQAAGYERHAVAVFKRATKQQRAVFAGVAALVLATSVLAVYKLAHRSEPEPEKAVIAAVEKTEPAKQILQTPPAPAPAPKVVIKPPVEKKIQGVKESARIRTLEDTTGGPAVISLAILPWGEIYLDGKKQGVSPPLMELQVVAGRHTLEIRNSTFPVHKQVIRVKPGANIKIRHSFQ